MHHGIRDVKRGTRTKRRTKDLDQIHESIVKTGLIPAINDIAAAQSPAIDPDETLPGMGQFHCIHCDRHFISEDAKTRHLASKVHRKRVKLLREEPYSQKEAEGAVGLGTDKGLSQDMSDI
ncbi:Bud site selection protein 20 [Nowakowskiella sp. JEL0407]|nr:Bud site selection protein 20 [Nowakowskiella sp. JEL0407]